MDKIKILVVDDESRMRKLVKDFLTKKNFQVLEAGDGEEAMDIFYKEKDIALLILDVMMPGMDGLELIKNAKKICPELEIIIISGYAHFEYARNAPKKMDVDIFLLEYLVYIGTCTA